VRERDGTRACESVCAAIAREARSAPQAQHGVATRVTRWSGSSARADLRQPRDLVRPQVRAVHETPVVAHAVLRDGLVDRAQGLVRRGMPFMCD